MPPLARPPELESAMRVPAPDPWPSPPLTWSQWWPILPALFLVGRLASIAGLYLLPTPLGRLVAEDPWNLGRVTLLAELGSFFAVSGLLWLATAKASPRTHRIAWHVALVTLLLYAIIAEIDVHLRRWMGLRLNLVFLRHFGHAAVETSFWSLLRVYLAQDLRAITLSVLVVFGPPIAALLLRPRQVRAPGFAAAGVLSVLGAVLLAWSGQLGIAVRKWRMVAPIPYALTMDLARELRVPRTPPSPEQLAALSGFVGRRSGNPDFPMWKPAANEAASLTAFRARPLEQRPDVFLIAIESLRGWVADWRSPTVAARLPNLAALFRERGVAFVHSHSNGFPSGEGNTNLNLGVWSHPARALPAEHVAIRSRSLPQILRDAGYQTLWLTGSDPSFDNLQHFVGRWFDRWELHGGNDFDLARGIIAAYDHMRSDAPRFLSIYTYSTHPFYVLPPEEGPTPPDSEAAYVRALAYADRALGQIFDHVRKQGRWDQTVFVITGDHSQPTPWHLAHDEDLGPPNAGRTWTGLMIAGPGLTPGSVRVDATSHVDVPPTILGRLGIEASHHFLGRDLFADPAPRPVLSVFRDSVALIDADTMLIGDLAGESLRKFKYDLGPLPDPLRYQHGNALPLTGTDRDAFARARLAISAYAWLLDHDHLQPPP